MVLRCRVVGYMHMKPIRQYTIRASRTCILLLLFKGCMLFCIVDYEECCKTYCCSDIFHARLINHWSTHSCTYIVTSKITNFSSISDLGRIVSLQQNAVNRLYYRAQKVTASDRAETPRILPSISFLQKSFDSDDTSLRRVTVKATQAQEAEIHPRNLTLDDALHNRHTRRR